MEAFTESDSAEYKEHVEHLKQTYHSKKWSLSGMQGPVGTRISATKELDTRGGSTCKSNLGQFSMFCGFKNSKVYMSSEFGCYNSSCYSLQMTNEFFLQTSTNEDAVRERERGGPDVRNTQ